MKTEPDVFSFDDLVRAKKRTTSWEGVRNYTARNLMRDEFALGDRVFIYHSSCEVPGIVGTAKVVKLAHPDLAALNPKSEYFDEKSAKLGESRWVMVDVQADQRFGAPVTLAAMKETKGLEDIMVIKRGTRLSIQPVNAKEAQVILRLGKPGDL